MRLLQVINDPTRVPRNSSSLTDIIFISAVLELTSNNIFDISNAAYQFQVARVTKMYKSNTYPLTCTYFRYFDYQLQIVFDLPDVNSKLLLLCDNVIDLFDTQPLLKQLHFKKL